MASSTFSTVTIPPSLAFLVSNFHSLVNIKLDGPNFLLWKTQVENVLNANGFLGYVDGTVACPSSQIRNSTGDLVTNPDFSLWKLIDSQLLACLTASLSQATLPYVLGFHHSYEVWGSLNNRYNSLSRTHAHELRSKLYSLTKSSTMESYIDTIKTYAQKIAAAGSPLTDEDLVFHTLHGLPPSFNGFKTGIRTRGNTDLSFDELITMLSGEDIQMSQDSSTTIETYSALVATPTISMSSNSEINTSASTSSTPIPQQISRSPQFSSSVSYLLQSQFFSPQFRPHFNRGRGGRGPRPRDPCAICGKTNHVTQYCYYNGQFPSFVQSFSPGFPIFPQSQGRGSPYNIMSYVPTGMPNHGLTGQFQSNHGLTGQFQPNQFQPNHGLFGQFQPSRAYPPVPQFSIPTGAFGNYVQSGPNPYAQAHFAGYSGGGFPISDPYAASTSTPPTGFSVPLMNSGYQGLGYTTGAQQGNPWYFDSGATSHITNNLQNIENPQFSSVAGGVQVGNGSQLQVTHSGSGQGITTNTLPGAMQQGPVPSVELL